MELTAKNVRPLIASREASVTDETDGVRIYEEDWGMDSATLVGDIIKAALLLELSPEQVRSNFVGEGDFTPDTQGCGSGPTVIDVTFLK